MAAPTQVPDGEQKLQDTHPTKSSEDASLAPQATREYQRITPPNAGEAPEEQIPELPREGSPLEQYIPKALLRKLESARASGDILL